MLKFMLDTHICIFGIKQATSVPVLRLEDWVNR
ncbi:hypothetical protein EPIR_0147 [Erwinia piriflorinigrans CFBP 5888]|uniref:Uncharacterized protein n=1 Tax=Erwinia piriflorinigrans CFBP 5888 TaxID=1161919 RepID=V5Z2T8_9GAMM|nr:hypothetical protein EPIR_0147 [Erwinia piriflorinigrans CFBP 5888]